jgi:hypothetical protein
LSAIAKIEELALPEPVRSHAIRLHQLLQGAQPPEEDPDRATTTALEYLAWRVDDLTVDPQDFAVKRGVRTIDVLRRLPDIRSRVAYRSYVGGWIRSGRTLRTEGLSPPATLFRVIEDSDVSSFNKDRVPTNAKKQGILGKILTGARRAFASREPSESWTGTSGLRSYYNKDESPD